MTNKSRFDVCKGHDIYFFLHWIFKVFILIVCLYLSIVRLFNKDVIYFRQLRTSSILANGTSIKICLIDSKLLVCVAVVVWDCGCLYRSEVL